MENKNKIKKLKSNFPFVIAKKTKVIYPPAKLKYKSYFDFGCGYNKREGYIGVDRNPLCNPDIIGDITIGVPEIESNTANYVCSLHELEHMHEHAVIKSLEEIARILKEKGKWEIRVPHSGSDSAMMPGHVHTIPPNYFWDFYKLEQFDREPLSNLIVDKIVITPNSEAYFLADSLNLPIECIVNHFRNISDEIIIFGHKK